MAQCVVCTGAQELQSEVKLLKLSLAELKGKMTNMESVGMRALDEQEKRAQCELLKLTEDKKVRCSDLVHCTYSSLLHTVFNRTIPGSH